MTFARNEVSDLKKEKSVAMKGEPPFHLLNICFVLALVACQSLSGGGPPELCGGWRSGWNSDQYTFFYENGMVELDDPGKRSIRKYKVGFDNTLYILDGERWHDWFRIVEIRKIELLYEYPMPDSPFLIKEAPQKWTREEACRPFDEKLHPVPPKKGAGARGNNAPPRETSPC